MQFISGCIASTKLEFPQCETRYYSTKPHEVDVVGRREINIIYYARHSRRLITMRRDIYFFLSRALKIRARILHSILRCEWLLQHSALRLRTVDRYCSTLFLITLNVSRANIVSLDRPRTLRDIDKCNSAVVVSEDYRDAAK